MITEHASWQPTLRVIQGLLYVPGSIYRDNVPEYVYNLFALYFALPFFHIRITYLITHNLQQSNLYAYM
jgi:hypothetical protein